MTSLRTVISFVVVILQYARSNLYACIDLISMILTLICIFLWIEIATEDNFKLDSNGDDDHLFERVDTKVK